MTEEWALTESATKFLIGIARSLGAADIDELARNAGFNNAQDMADKYGFINILAFFSAADNHVRYVNLEILLDEIKHRDAMTKIT